MDARVFLGYASSIVVLLLPLSIDSVEPAVASGEDGLMQISREDTTANSRNFSYNSR